MDTERWQILLKAIDRGSLRAAADEMGFTVSGISRSVATLEKELGFALLYRAKSGVQPTAECRQLLPSVRELFCKSKVELRERGGRMKRQQTVKIRLFKDTGEYREPVFVAVNGESYLIRRGEDVEVPDYIAEVLEASARQDAGTAALIEARETRYAESAGPRRR